MPERVPSACVFHRSWPRPHKWSTSGISWDLQRPGRNRSISQERSGWWALGIVDYLMGSRSVLRWVLLARWWMNLWTYRCLFRCIWGFLWSVSWAKNEACFQTKRSEILNLHCKRIWDLSPPYAYLFFSFLLEALRSFGKTLRLHCTSGGDFLWSVAGRNASWHGVCSDLLPAPNKRRKQRWKLNSLCVACWSWRMHARSGINSMRTSNS